MFIPFYFSFLTVTMINDDKVVEINKVLCVLLALNNI